jgi:histidyl-tRNA synthetase
MALSTQPYKGARDFYPEDKRIQKYMFSVIRSTVEKFGYEEYDAPILEPTELFASKTSDEIVNEQTYTFTDRGDRSVTIRTEMTPSVSRMVAGRRMELTYPLRWYSIPNIWRYERPQRGRLREFWQLNVDLFGVEGIAADFEAIQVADAILQAFKAKRSMYTIKINSRKLLNELLHDYLQLDNVQSGTLIKLIDRMNKMEPAAFKATVDAIFTPSQREAGRNKLLFDVLKIQSLDNLPAQLQSHPSVKELRSLLVMLKKEGITNAQFDISLMRGFDYYTDIVFEVFDNNPENNRSMFGGGRYDGLVGMFGVEPVPTVGFGMGDVTLQNFLESHRLLKPRRPEVDVYVVLIGELYQKANKALSELREMGLNVAVDMTNRKADKQLKTAVKKGINYVLFIGENELNDEQYMLKNLKTGEEKRVSLQRAVTAIKDHRKA